MSSAPSFTDKVKKFFEFDRPEMKRKLEMEQNRPQQGGKQRRPEMKMNRKFEMEQNRPQQGGKQRRYEPAPVKEGMEPNWTRQISSTTVCDWFYVFFIFNAVFVVVLIFTMFSTMKGGVRARLFMVLPAAIIGAVNLLFWYLMCERANLSHS
jgi:hypothetical protein